MTQFYLLIHSPLLNFPNCPNVLYSSSSPPSLQSNTGSQTVYVSFIYNCSLTFSYFHWQWCLYRIQSRCFVDYLTISIYVTVPSLYSDYIILARVLHRLDYDFNIGFLLKEIKLKIYVLSKCEFVRLLFENKIIVLKAFPTL